MNANINLRQYILFVNPRNIDIVDFKCFTVLHIRRSNRDNLAISSHISPLNIFCDPSLEPSHRDSLNEGTQHVVVEK